MKYLITIYKRAMQYCELHGRITEFDAKWIYFRSNEDTDYLFKRARVKFMQKDLPD